MLDALGARYSAPEPQANGHDLRRSDTVSATPGDVVALLHDIDKPTIDKPEDRSENFASAVWKLARRGMSPDQIEAEIRDHAPVTTARYEAEGRLRQEIDRSFDKWLQENGLCAPPPASAPASQSAPAPGAAVNARGPNGPAPSPPSSQPPVTPSGTPPQGSQRGRGGGSGTPPPSGPPGGSSGSSSGSGPSAAGTAQLPHIFIQKGRLPDAVNEAEAALIKSGTDMFSRDGVLMRSFLHEFRTVKGEQGQAWRMEPVTIEWLVRRLTCCAMFYRFDKRGKNWVWEDCPDKVAKSYLYGMGGEYKLPKLAGVVTTPFLRPDGTVASAVGWDAATWILRQSDGRVFPEIASEPSREDGIRALARVDELLEEFPFKSGKTGVDHSVAMAGILTALDRYARPAPLFGVSAPQARSGKSLYVDLIGILLDGSVVASIPESDRKELEKCINGALLSGNGIISIDNLSYPLRSSLI
jgi:hypothetical protein